MNTDLIVGLVTGIVVASCVAIQLHYAPTRNRSRRATTRLKQSITVFWPAEDPWTDEELDDAAIADEAALGIRDINKYLKKQKEAGQ